MPGERRRALRPARAGVGCIEVVDGDAGAAVLVDAHEVAADRCDAEIIRCVHLHFVHNRAGLTIHDGHAQVVDAALGLDPPDRVQVVRRVVGRGGVRVVGGDAGDGRTGDARHARDFAGLDPRLLRDGPGPRVPAPVDVHQCVTVAGEREARRQRRAVDVQERVRRRRAAAGLRQRPALVVVGVADGEDGRLRVDEVRLRRLIDAAPERELDGLRGERHQSASMPITAT